MIKIEKDLAKR
jgi:hypothetical protein